MVLLQPNTCITGITAALSVPEGYCFIASVYLCSVGEVDDARSKFRIIVYSGIMLVTIGISHYYIRVGKKERQEKEVQLMKTLEGRKSS